MSNIKKNIFMALGAISFIIGLILISFMTWLLLMINNPETPLLTLHNMGAILILGMALMSIGTIVMLITIHE